MSIAKNKKIKNKKAIVIGAGFGGLAIAIRLQAMGFNTEIYEKNARVGGHASQIKKKGYTFDLGPSIITLPVLFEELFKLNNEDYRKYLDINLLDPFYRIYFHDKSFIDYSGNEAKMISQIEKFNKKDAQNYLRFMKYSKDLYDVVIKEGLGAKPFLSWIDFLHFIPKALKLKIFIPSYYMVLRYFKDFRIRFLFSFHSLFIGGSPFTSPSIFLMLPYLEKEGGVWFCTGGMYKVIQELEKLFIRMGGKIYTNSEVSKINIKDGKIYSINVNNNESICDLVVSNSHYANTYLDLIDKVDRPFNTDKRVLNKNYSMSSFLLYIGVKKKYKNLKHHTLILSERYKGLVDDIFKNKILPNDFSLYLHAPSISDPSLAPKESESIYILSPVANLEAGIDWNIEKDIYADKIIDFLEKDFGLKELRKNIEVKEIFTPVDFKNIRNNYLGAAWSLQPLLFQTANFRPHNKSEDIENLYLVGASTHPGGGVPGVILSAKVTEKIIQKDYGLYDSDI